MVLKRHIDSYIDNFYNTTNKALLLTGARQTGKTFSIREFGKKFESFIEINFIDQPEAKALFRNYKSADDLLLRISSFTTKPLIKDKTLIFFDEVQECKEIVTAIKFLVDNGSYRYILSGSLLGVNLHDVKSMPVGYLGIKTMYPLDLEEFIINVNPNRGIIDEARRAFMNRVPVDQVVNDKLMEYFRLYLVVGGMPQSVIAYLDSYNMQTVAEVQIDIINLYKKDISQYAEKDKLRIEEIFDLIPPELNAKNKRFILKELNRNVKYSRAESSFLWLKNAGVAIPVYNVEEPKSPLLLSRSRNLFKLFSNDVGLLAAQYGNGIQFNILSGDEGVNFGAIYENYVAQELTAHDFTPYYYNNKKKGEVDFVVEQGVDILPIEVKSGKDYYVHRALDNILDTKEYKIDEAIVLDNYNLKKEGRVSYLPIYMTMFIKKNTQAPVYYKISPL